MKVISIDLSLPMTYYLAEVREATEDEKLQAAKVSYPPFVCEDGKCYKWLGGICLDDLHHTVWNKINEHLHIDGRKPDGWDWNGHPFFIINDAEYDRIITLSKRLPIEKELGEAEKQYRSLLAKKEGGKLITEAERRAKAKEYSLGMLEGGEGYNPFTYMETIEQFNYWEKRYNDFKEQLAFWNNEC